MKKKTSVSIDNKILAVVKREAVRQDRSVSYILEKFIEEKAKTIIEEEPPAYAGAGGTIDRISSTARALIVSKKRQAKRKSAA